MEKNLKKYPSVSFGNNFQCENNVVIYEKVKIGNNVLIGNNVVVYPHTVIGNDVVVFDNAVLGRPPKFGPASLSIANFSLGPLILGDGVAIGTSAVIYQGVNIGQHSYVADLVHIREDCRIGKYCSIGKCTSLEPKVIMEDEAKIAACSQIAALTEIKRGAFVGADVSICTDTSFGRIKNSDKKVVIEEGAMIGSNASLAPGVIIGKNAMVALGAVVLKNVPENKVVFGNPAKIMWDVNEKLKR